MGVGTWKQNLAEQRHSTLLALAKHLHVYVQRPQSLQICFYQASLAETVRAARTQIASGRSSPSAAMGLGADFQTTAEHVRVGRRICRSWLSRSGAGREFGLGRFLGPVLIWSDFKSLLSVLLISWQPTRMKREEGGALLATYSSRPGREQ